MNEYTEFIGSDDWKKIRETALQERGLVCERCHNYFKKGELEIHHNNYGKEFCFEDEEDLLVVCFDCHRILERDLNTYNPDEDRKVCFLCHSILEGKTERLKGNREVHMKCYIFNYRELKEKGLLK